MANTDQCTLGAGRVQILCLIVCRPSRLCRHGRLILPRNARRSPSVSFPKRVQASRDERLCVAAAQAVALKHVEQGTQPGRNQQRFG